MTVELFVRDRDGSVLDQLDEFTRFELTLRRNDVSAWSLDAPFTRPATELAQPGRGLIIELNGHTYSGPVTQMTRTWEATEDGWSISGVTDDVFLWERLAYPCVPNGTPPTLFSADSHDDRSGAAETVMRAYVAANMVTGGAFASGSLASRAISGLSLATDLGRGSSVTGHARFQIVGELLAELALAGGDLGFGISDMQFWIDTSEDRSAEVVVSPEVGNMVSFSYELNGPSATHVVVAGGGELTARAFVIGGDDVAATGSWRRIEQFRDRRDTTDVVEMTQSLNEELTNGAQKSGLRLRPVDIPSMLFDVDHIGDTVTAIVDGVEIVDVIRQVEFTIDGSGEVVVPMIERESSTGPSSVLEIFDHMRLLERRIDALERSF